MRDSIQRWLRYSILAVLAFGLVMLGVNAFAALAGWLSGGETRKVVFTVGGLGSGILLLILGALFGCVYWFKSADGFDVIKERLPKVVPALLLLWGVSRLLASRGSPAYGPFDALATFATLGVMVWPLWLTRESLLPPRPLPPEPEPEPEPEPQLGMPGMAAPDGPPDETMVGPPGAFGGLPFGGPPMGPPQFPEPPDTGRPPGSPFPGYPPDDYQPPHQGR